MLSTTIAKPLSVVVVDDNFDNRIIIKTFIKEMGFSCQTLIAGWHLFTEQITKHVDLILLDIEMPLENGFDIIAKIRQDPRLMATKVVAVTSNRDIMTSQKALRAGFAGYILKPLERGRFQQQINQIIVGAVVWEGTFT
jgi:CheY-like chemotaxis protein